MSAALQQMPTLRPPVCLELEPGATVRTPQFKYRIVAVSGQAITLYPVARADALGRYRTVYMATRQAWSRACVLERVQSGAWRIV